MSPYARDDALAFIEAMRLTLAGKVGFKWLVERLADLTSYIETLADENEQLNAYLDDSGSRGDFEAYRALHPRGPHDEDAADIG